MRYFRLKKPRIDLNEFCFHLAGSSRPSLYPIPSHLTLRQIVAGCNRNLGSTNKSRGAYGVQGPPASCHSYAPSILIVDDIRFAISRGPSMATNVLQVGGHVIGAFHRPKPKPRDRGTGRKCREYLCVTLAPVLVQVILRKGSPRTPSRATLMAYRVHKSNPIEATGNRKRVATSEVITECNHSIIF